MLQKSVLITGGSRGIGNALVQVFKEANWRVATCSSKMANLAQSKADLRIECDVSRVEAVRNCLAKVSQEFGRIDVLINNAGLAGTNPMSPDQGDELWHQILDVNLNGTYYFCKYAAPLLPDHHGKVLNVASVLALRGVPDQVAYCAAKHGVLGLTRALAHYFAPRRITVNAICPGWVRTAMAEGRMKEIGINEQSLSSSVPLGRFIEPEEIAQFMFDLASSSATAMLTGQALTLDGGSLV